MASLAFIEGIGGPELMIIMFIVLLLFGPKKLPELARSLGKTAKVFKQAASDAHGEIHRAMETKEDQPKQDANPTPLGEITDRLAQAKAALLDPTVLIKSEIAVIPKE